MCVLGLTSTVTLWQDDLPGRNRSTSPKGMNNTEQTKRPKGQQANSLQGQQSTSLGRGWSSAGESGIRHGSKVLHVYPKSWRTTALLLPSRRCRQLHTTHRSSSAKAIAPVALQQAANSRAPDTSAPPRKHGGRGPTAHAFRGKSRKGRRRNIALTWFTQDRVYVPCDKTRSCEFMHSAF